MNVEGRTAVVTGAGGGIGAALAGALVDAGARVLLADIDGERAHARAAELDEHRPGSAIGAGADVSDEDALRDLLAQAEAAFGPVEVFCANAGISGGQGLGMRDEDWLPAVEVNVLAHVRAARLLIPGWVERGEGCFVSTASAAGLLTQIGSGPYSVTKHAAVGFAEWLSVTYGDQGVHVSCLCPMAVDTAMLAAGVDAEDETSRMAAKAVTTAGAVLSPDEVAAAVLEAVADERFLVLPHPEVLEFYRRKGLDYDRWLRGMRRLQRTVGQST